MKADTEICINPIFQVLEYYLVTGPAGIDVDVPVDVHGQIENPPYVQVNSQ